jgi:hypothetical protein
MALHLVPALWLIVAWALLVLGDARVRETAVEVG